MSKSFMEKFKHFWGFEANDEVLTDEVENGEYDRYSESSATSYGQEKSKIFSATSKGKVVNIHNNANFKIDVFEPRTFEEAVEIVECLRSKRPVVINLEEIDPELARKIFDFLSGALCAIDGKAEKISKGIFIMAPDNVQITGAADSTYLDAPKFSLTE
ncbi:MAG: cell division protein SepF [Clostridiales bacterium]|nr:MAG: cell division protein SepF [Clostridiales bacterium]